jgi:hypothetical protein
MKERLTTLLLAAAALLLFYIFLFPKPAGSAATVSQPLSTDTGVDGQMAIWRWLQAEKIPVSSLRYRYDHLWPAGAAAGGGNVLITVMPHQLLIRKDEWRPLNRWIDSGNTLLVLAALDDTPNWSLGSAGGFLDELKQLTQISFVERKDEGAKQSDADRLQTKLNGLLGNPDIELVPTGQHALLSGIRSVRGTSDLPASRWNAIAVAPTIPVQLLQRSDSGAQALLLVRRGKGQIIVSTLASPFSNREIDQADNAQLLSNIIGWSRSDQGTVIFDDDHQGLTEYYDPRAFFADPRLHHTLVWIVLLWLVFVLGPLPLRHAHSPWQPVDDTALIEASGRFYSSAVTPVDAAHRMFENFFNGLRHKLNLPENGAPLWDWLKSQSIIRDDERAQLHNLYSKIYASERIELKLLHNLLSNLQGK